MTNLLYELEEQPALTPEEQATELYEHINAICPYSCAKSQQPTPYQKFRNEMQYPFAKDGYTFANRDINGLMNFWGAVSALNLLELYRKLDIEQFCEVITAYLEILTATESTWLKADKAANYNRRERTLWYFDSAKNAPNYSAKNAPNSLGKITELLLLSFACDPFPIPMKHKNSCADTLKKFVK